MTLTKLCDVAAVAPGEMIPAEVEGLLPLAVYNVDGEFFVTSNVCTHSVAMLTDGDLEDGIVECPMHGGMFNVKTGEATHYPCFEPLQTYKVVVQDGGVFIEV